MLRIYLLCLQRLGGFKTDQQHLNEALRACHHIPVQGLNGAGILFMYVRLLFVNKYVKNGDYVRERAGRAPGKRQA